jgi:hypothetical protein
MSDASDQLRRVQQWMQAVITHPEGVEAGVESAAAREQLDVDARQLATVIEPSAALTSAERLDIYARAYFARLIECLRDEYPILARTLGEELFDAFAVDYLGRYPSRSYTLNRLGASFADDLRETASAEDAAWATFLVDLARLEWTFNEVFDGPGTEQSGTLDAAALEAIEPAAWPRLRLVPVPCLRLLTCSYPVNAYYSALRAGEEPRFPDAVPSFVAISRRNYIVERHDLEETEFDLLASLVNGKCVGDAIEQLAVAGQSRAMTNDLSKSIRQWFERWGQFGFFREAQHAGGSAAGS